MNKFKLADVVQNKEGYVGMVVSISLSSVTNKTLYKMAHMNGALSMGYDETLRVFGE